MKFLKKIVLGASLLVFSSFQYSSQVKSTSQAYSESHKKSAYTETVRSIIHKDNVQNQALFFPLNKYFVGFDHSEDDFSIKLLEEQKAAIQFNLWNIITYHFHQNNLKLYLPWDPNWMANKDDGYLFYEISSEKYGSIPNASIDTDAKFKEELKMYEVLGRPIIDQNPYPYTANDGFDSLDENGNTVYPPDQFVWHQDKDIVGYKIKETWTYNKSGELKSKKIDAIAPLVNTTDYTGNVVGIRELFWVDFNELAPILKDYYVFSKNMSIKRATTFNEYFEDVKYHAINIEKDSLGVK